MTKKEALEMGGREWQKNGNHRIYFNGGALEVLYGLEILRYKTGNISSATFNGEDISNSKANKLLNKIICERGDRAYYDVIADRMVGMIDLKVN